MTDTFYKYQGTGNDFILIDNRNRQLMRTNNKCYADWCHRRFGIGADGLILLQDHPLADFEMVYFNSDGRESSMCGNGGRCIVQFAFDLGLIKRETEFIAIDGKHRAKVLENAVSLQMQDVSDIEELSDALWLNTGSPHYVRFFSNDLVGQDIIAPAKEIRYSERFKAEGTNVNFVNIKEDHLFVRTYERGVEDETFSCGTGVTAAALAWAYHFEAGKKYSVGIQTPGGGLQVSFFKEAPNRYTDIWLTGPATFVFKGEITIL